MVFQQFYGFDGVIFGGVMAEVVVFFKVIYSDEDGDLFFKIVFGIGLIVVVVILDKIKVVFDMVFIVIIFDYLVLIFNG